MEFKGTKEDWRLLDGVIYDEQYNVIAECYTTCEKDYYNALLIKHSKEMLEMLRNIKEQLNEDDKWSVEQLIKQATEI